jgi:hypothetical protein
MAKVGGVVYWLCWRLTGHACLWSGHEGHSLMTRTYFYRCTCGLMRCWRRNWKRGWR